jgi:hypothetical protein
VRRIEPHQLWIGHAGDLRNLRQVTRAGVVAIVDLAVNEMPLVPPREMAYARFPLVDGVGNPSWLVRAAIACVASLIRSRTPSLVSCSAGMSRSPAIVAGALAMISRRPPDEVLSEVVRGAPADVSPALWNGVLGSIRQGDLLEGLRSF